MERLLSDANLTASETRDLVVSLTEEQRHSLHAHGLSLAAVGERLEARLTSVGERLDGRLTVLGTGEADQHETSQRSLDALAQQLSVISAAVGALHPPDALARFRADLATVELYQPLYGLDHRTLGIPPAERSSLDRLDVIIDFLGDVQGLRVLDVGSSLGFFALALADRGALVTGIDSSEANVAVATGVATLNGIAGATFNVATFDPAWIQTLPSGGFDVALVLSVVHHSYAAEGFEATHDLIKSLLDRVPVVIAELAHGNEEHDKAWVATAPADPWQDFTSDPRIEVRPLGGHPTHLSTTPRQMAAMWRTGVQRVRGRAYRVDETELRSHAGASIRWGRRFALATGEPDEAVFLKQYQFEGYIRPTHERDDNETQLINEIANYRHLELARVLAPDSPAAAHFPRIIDFEISERFGTIVLSPITGPILSSESLYITESDARRVLQELADALVFLRDVVGLYHNDIRPWNVALGNPCTLFDLGLASPVDHSSLQDDLALFEPILLRNIEGWDPVTLDHLRFTLASTTLREFFDRTREDPTSPNPEEHSEAEHHG